MTFISPSWHLNMTLDLVTMHWAPDCLCHSSRQNGLWTPTLFQSIHSFYMCIRERTQPFDVEQAPKNSHCQNTACGKYINIQGYARSHMVSKHLPDHSNSLPSHSQAIILLLAQVQVYGINTSFSTHPLYTGHCYLSIIVLVVIPISCVSGKPCAKCL